MSQASFFEKKCNYFGHVGSRSGYRRGASFSAGDYWNVLPAPRLVLQKHSEDSRTCGSGCSVKPSCSPARCPCPALLPSRWAGGCTSPCLCSPACVPCAGILPHLYAHSLPREPEELPSSAGKCFDKSPVKIIPWAHRQSYGYLPVTPNASSAITRLGSQLRERHHKRARVWVFSPPLFP